MPNDPKRRFLRIYFDDLERDYKEVWFDPTCLSTYVRLLSLAEKAWPSDPEMPLAVRQADLATLTKLKLVTVVDERFRMKGWKKERTSRAKAAKGAADKRWHGNADAMQPHSDGNARASSSSSVVVPPVLAEGGPGGNALSSEETAVFVYLAQRGGAIPPEKGLGQRLLKLMDRRGPAIVLATAMELGKDGPLSDRQWVFGLEQAIEPTPDPKAAAKAIQQAETDRAAAKRQERRDAERDARRMQHYRATGEWPFPGEPPVAA